MRWRITIAVMAVLTIAGALYFGTQPKKGTVEWHKKEYLRARKELETGVPAWVLKKGVPGIMRKFYERRFTRQLDFHRTALIDSGYLKQSVFVVSNSSPLSVWRTAAHDLLVVVPKEVWNFSWIQQTNMNTNTLMVVVPRDWFEKIGDAIRKADVPEAPREWSDKIGVAIRKVDVPETK